MESLINAKSADSRSKRIIHGYIHRSEIQLKLPEIASLIINIILGFYYSGEFISKFLDKYFEVSQDKLTITNLREIEFEEHTIYLNQWIESMSKAIVRWTFKINAMSNHNRTRIFFGFASKERPSEYDFTTDKCEFIPNYSISNYSSPWIDGRTTNINVPMQYEMRKDDLVSFTLDLVSKKWKCRIHGKTDELEICDVKTSDNIRYKFVLQIACVGDSITLVNYDHSL